MSSNKEALPAEAFGLLIEESSETQPSRFSTPKRIIRWFTRLNWLFIFTVVVPTLLVAGYYVFFASDIYISNSSFIVRSASQQTHSSLSSIIKSATGGSGSNDSYNVEEFMTSRDALMILDKEVGMRRAYGNPAIDRISRFGGIRFWDNSFEELYRYYNNWIIDFDLDEDSSISKVEVRAFNAEDARLINEKLLEIGEKVVNDMNNALEADMLRFASGQVDAAKEEARKANAALADFRNGNTLVEPEHQSSMQLELIMKLQEELIDTENSMTQLSNSVADNPQIPVLKDKIKSLQAEIALEMQKASGVGTSLTRKASEYERLTTDRNLAEKEVGEALTFLDTTRVDTQRQLLYLERIVEPQKPDVAIEPKRLRNTFATLVIGLVVWGIISLFVAGVREHQQ